MSWQLQCDLFRWRSSFWIVATLMLALSGVASEAAHASCGDHLQRMPQHVDPNLVDDVGHQSSPSIPEAPCNGPGCRRAPAVPDTPSPVDVRPTSFERLTAAPKLLSMYEEVSDSQRGDVLLPQEGHRAGLDRPPQSA